MPNISSEILPYTLFDLGHSHNDNVIMDEKNSNTIQLSLVLNNTSSLPDFYSDYMHPSFSDMSVDMPTETPRLTRSIAGLNTLSSLPGDNPFH
jgi:hypothetical protein